jgi:AraC family transcriptional regulator
MGKIDYFTATKSHCLLPLSVRPTILQRGLAVHGLRGKTERYFLERFWCLHTYTYHAALILDDGTRFEIAPGSLGLTPPGTALTYDFIGRSEHFYVHFALPELPGDAKIATLGRTPDGFGESLSEWHPTPLRAEVRLWDLLFRLAESAPGTPSTLPPEVQQTLARIDAGLTDVLRVPTLAEAAGLSPSYLTRRFREATGQTIAGYIVARRLERARYLLRYTRLSVKEIAAQVGIPDLGTFHKTFSRAEGIGPRAWRERVH